MSPAYLSQKLTRPLVTKDGGTLRTILDARAYMLALSKDQERRAPWQRAAKLILAQANVADFSRQVELACPTLTAVAVAPSPTAAAPRDGRMVRKFY